MHNDSISNSICHESPINEIRLHLSNPSAKIESYVVVEGKDDSCFLRDYISSKAILVESNGGKFWVRKAVEHFNDKSVIGICDRDYDYCYSNARVFHYDHNCLEIMLAANDSAFKKIANEYYDGELDFSTIRSRVLNGLKPLSLFRRESFLNDWKLKFEGCLTKDIIDYSLSTIVPDKLYNRLLRINRDKTENVFAGKEVVNRKLQDKTEYNDLLSITQGHDFIRFLKHILDRCSTGKSPDLNLKDLSRNFRLAYTPSMLVTTNLYADIQLYEKTSKAQAFLSVD